MPGTAEPQPAHALMVDDLPREFPDRGWWLVVQRVAAAIALAMLAIVLAPIAVAIRMESPGPVLFRQPRRGLRDRQFTILKFRTMRLGTERATALGTTSRTPGVTRIGRLLRATKLDELPQLWNVVCGDMEFVGPRPLPLALDNRLRELIPGFHLRSRVRPGLTNIAQISVAENDLGDRLVRDWGTRFDAELQYIRRKSVRFDLLLLGMTAVFILRKFVGRRVGAGVPGSVRSVRVLGVPIACLDYRGVCSQISEWIGQRQNHYVGVCPVHNIIEALLSRRHRAVLQGAGLNTADGMPVVWAKWLLGDRAATRVYGPTLMLHLLELAQTRGWRVAFYGGRPATLDMLTYRMRWKFPAINLVSTISPPFGGTTEEERACVAELIASEPQLTFVGLGCPKQERWMATHAGIVPGVMIGVGAGFDFHAGTIPQAPAWMQRYGLEWVYRLACEPRRLAKRYATTNPLYVVAFSVQLLSHVLLRRNFVGWHAPLPREQP